MTRMRFALLLFLNGTGIHLLSCNITRESTLTTTQELKPTHQRVIVLRDGEEAGVFEDLQEAIDFSRDGDSLLLGQATFRAKPTPYTDQSCANCIDGPLKYSIETTLGFKIIDKQIHLSGAGKGPSILNTGAGYGLYIEDSVVELDNLQITGGLRAEEKQASDGAIVVRRSKVQIEKLHIVRNWNRFINRYPGIAGIVGREDAVISVRHSLIEYNSWDGFVLYDNAQGEIYDSIIRNGQGVGIAATYRSRMLAVRNKVSAYWKGMGTFIEAEGRYLNNLVIRQKLWGMIASSSKRSDFINNTVVENGRCGIVMWDAESQGSIVNNIVQGNGFNLREKVTCERGGLIWNDYQTRAYLLLPWLVLYNFSSGNYADRNFAVWRNTEDDGPIYALDNRRLGKNRETEASFSDDGSYRLNPESSLRNAGDPRIRNRDGSQSDPGAYGGPESME